MKRSSRIVMVCQECGLELFVDSIDYFYVTDEHYRVEYQLIDENNHRRTVFSGIKPLVKDTPDYYLVKYMIQSTQTRISL